MYMKYKICKIYEIYYFQGLQNIIYIVQNKILHSK
jgi:hypothetical protein